MRMARVTLTDGTTREITFEELDNMSISGMSESFDNKAIINVEFFEEDGR